MSVVERITLELRLTVDYENISKEEAARLLRKALKFMLKEGLLTGDTQGVVASWQQQIRRVEEVP